jgi:hypothetical protein
VKTVVDDRLLEEAERFALRFACEDCAHFDGGGERCLHAFPTAPHRRALLRPGSVLSFCKEFELDG